MKACWCGNAELAPFSREYGRCIACGTLVSVASLTPDELVVHDDDKDFYGKRYWLAHQNEDLGFPDIHSRARNDLAERNLHWLKTLLKYRLPPARIMELGCAHGSFIALMKQAGYESSGVELSAWVVDYARRTFEVPVEVGPLENLTPPPGSFDVIALMDVLEHLPDPVTTMRHCLDLLKPDGFLLIQTPHFEEDMRHDELIETDGAFLEMLTADEHLYLFTERSFEELFRRLGVSHIRFEPAIFAQYDMFAVVSKSPLLEVESEAIEAALSSSPGRRFVLALLDLREQERALAARLAESDADRTARGEQVEALTVLLTESEKDRALHVAQIDTLTALLKETQSESAARDRQLRELDALVAEVEADRAARGVQITELTRLVVEAEADRDARGAQIVELGGLLREVEADRAARGVQIVELGRLLAEAEADRAARGIRIRELGEVVAVAESDRAARGVQIGELGKLLSESESDRAARGAQVSELGRLLTEAEADRAARGVQIEQLRELLAEAEADREARRVQIGELGKLLSESESDRAARGVQILQLGKLLADAESDRAARGAQVVELGGLLAAAESDRAARGTQIAALNALLTEVEGDRAARGAQIERLTALLVESEADRAARGLQIDQLTALLNPVADGGNVQPGTDMVHRAIHASFAMTEPRETADVNRTDRARRLTALADVEGTAQADPGVVVARSEIAVPSVQETSAIRSERDEIA